MGHKNLHHLEIEANMHPVQICRTSLQTVNNNCLTTTMLLPGNLTKLQHFSFITIIFLHFFMPSHLHWSMMKASSLAHSFGRPLLGRWHTGSGHTQFVDVLVYLVLIWLEAFGTKNSNLTLSLWPALCSRHSYIVLGTPVFSSVITVSKQNLNLQIIVTSPL